MVATLPTSILAGDRPSGDDFTAILAYVTTLTSSWTDYSSTFTMTGSVSPATLGNSVVTARHRTVGQTVDVDITITFGTTYVNGSGSVKLLLPFPMRDVLVGAGSCYIADTGTANRGGLTVIGDQAADVNNINIIQNGTAGPVTFASPQVFASTDRLQLSFRYERA